MFLGALVLAATIVASSCEQVPLFAQFASQGDSLRGYTVPLETAVAIHKFLTFHVKLSGSVAYEQPGKVTLSMQRVPPEDRALFADVSAPRTWPQNYDLRVIGTSTNNDQKIYHMTGVPRGQSGVDHFLADVKQDGSSIAAQWFLRGGGTIVSTIENQNVGGFMLPKRELADIDASGYKIHVEITFGDYILNGPVALAPR
ncbi:MAG: hypothetical protein JO092_05240 [Candidatus Eremiobacteraeota bacterium]|nr:hypothetical protein [Candidatus Eremiobacteraeota bacterium]